MPFLDEAAQSILARGDLAHLALFTWAAVASVLLAVSLRELGAAIRRSITRHRKPRRHW
jgi:hypothetical protein